MALGRTRQPRAHVVVIYGLHDRVMSRHRVRATLRWTHPRREKGDLVHIPKTVVVMFVLAGALVVGWMLGAAAAEGKPVDPRPPLTASYPLSALRTDADRSVKDAAARPVHVIVVTTDASKPASNPATAEPRALSPTIVNIAAPANPTPQAGAPPATAAAPTTVSGVSIIANGNNIVIATDRSIVSVGDNTVVKGNTGDAGASGVIAIDVSGSTVTTGDSDVTTSTAPQGGTGQALVPGAASVLGAQAGGSSGTRATAIAGWDRRTVEVTGSDNLVGYDSSNLFYQRDGDLNGNTGDAKSSGLVAVDVAQSAVGSGRSCSASSPATALDAAELPSIPGVWPLPEGSGASVVGPDSIATATGDDTLVIGGDGVHDMGVQVTGDSNVVAYDGGNTVVGGTGDANAQVGDSDAGGVVVMSVGGSEIQAADTCAIAPSPEGGA